MESCSQTKERDRQLRVTRSKPQVLQSQSIFSYSGNLPSLSPASKSLRNLVCSRVKGHLIAKHSAGKQAFWFTVGGGSPALSLCFHEETSASLPWRKGWTADLSPSFFPLSLLGSVLSPLPFPCGKTHLSLLETGVEAQSSPLETDSGDWPSNPPWHLCRQASAPRRSSGSHADCSRSELGGRGVVGSTFGSWAQFANETLTVRKFTF